MSILDGVSLEFSETMAGAVTIGNAPEATPIQFSVRITISDLSAFLHDSQITSTLAGTLSCVPLGAMQEIHDGRFYLLRPDPASATYQMVYHFDFQGSDGRSYTFHGEKTLRDEPGFDLTDDLTKLMVTLHRGGDVFARGQMRFDLTDLPKLVASLKVTGASGPWAELAARVAFLSYAYGTLREEYLRGLRPVYDTQYENLVVQGQLQSPTGETRPFFVVTGMHDRGFPWGDGEIVWDVLLLIGDGCGGWQRFAISDRILSGLEVDVARGASRYVGPIFALSRNAASFSQMRRGAPELQPCAIELSLTYRAIPHAAVGLPFRELSMHLPTWTSRLADSIHGVLPATHPPGIWINPYTVQDVGGTIRLDRPDKDQQTWQVVTASALGEAERATFRNLREPTLLYHYLCAVDLLHQNTRVQIEARTMRNESPVLFADRFDALVGALIARMASVEIASDAGGCQLRPLRGTAAKSSEDAERLVPLGPPLLQIDNDHFPTAVFQRNIVEVVDRQGRKQLALEEAMRTLRLAPIGSAKKVRVAAVHDEDKRRALDAVLAATGFETLLEQVRLASGKPKAEFRIAIKPNFMFAYSKHDPSTFTDPELVAQLARHLRRLGYSQLLVVEAQSSYGEYFDHRSVKEMAEYLGYSGGDAEGPLYQIVDLTLDATEKQKFGPALGVHPVPRSWRDADFRISFAKNKTHAYAYYSLALKNVYGALPLAAKFKEYHCKRDIYKTTMEYLHAFPVHFALIDAYLSADGPFGVFADPLPNPTRTIIGGGNLVAVDWVGATKMGIDPLISPYMRLAVEQFGKPEIDFIGDASIYRPWLNVPPVLTALAHHVIDADFATGNLFYALTANMDSERFHFKDRRLLTQVARRFTKPLRDAFFVQTGTRPSLANRAAAWLQVKLGS